MKKPQKASRSGKYNIEATLLHLRDVDLRHFRENIRQTNNPKILRKYWFLLRKCYDMCQQSAWRIEDFQNVVFDKLNEIVKRENPNEAEIDPFSAGFLGESEDSET